MTDKDGLLRIQEAARYLCISRSKLYDLMEEGELAFVKLGKARRISRLELDELVQRKTNRRQDD